MWGKYFVLLLISACAVYVTVFGKPHQRGYFCDDKTIRYPYFDSPYNELNVLVACVFVANISVCLSLHRKQIKQLETGLYNLWFGLLCVYVAIFVAKLVIGELRPNFIDVCKPLIDCTNLSSIHRYRYISEFNCSSVNTTDLINYSRLSFPSAHAGIMFYLVTYVFIFAENKKSDRVGILKRLIQMLFLAVILQLNFLRVVHNFSHALDIIVGAVLGLLFAVFFHSRAVSQTKKLNVDEMAQAPLLDSSFEQ